MLRGKAFSLGYSRLEDQELSRHQNIEQPANNARTFSTTFYTAGRLELKYPGVWKRLRTEFEARRRPGIKHEILILLLSVVVSHY